MDRFKGRCWLIEDLAGEHFPDWLPNNGFGRTNHMWWTDLTAGHPVLEPVYWVCQHTGPDSDCMRCNSIGALLLEIEQVRDRIYLTRSNLVQYRKKINAFHGGPVCAYTGTVLGQQLHAIHMRVNGIAFMYQNIITTETKMFRELISLLACFGKWYNCKRTSAYRNIRKYPLPPATVEDVLNVEYNLTGKGMKWKNGVMTLVR